MKKSSAQHLPYFVALVLLAAPIISVAQSGPFFAISPTKIEYRLEPGESQTEYVTVVNRLGGTAEFVLSVEDYEPGETGQARLLGGGEGRYSLRPYVSMSGNRIVLAEGERSQLPVTVSLPASAPIASLHSALIVEGRLIDAPTAAVRVSSRIGVLLFVRVMGDAIEEGRLTRFGIAGGPVAFFSGRDPVAFISYENTGTTYVNPYGYIEARNLVTQKTHRQPVDPWYVLPYSTRTRDIDLAPMNLAGIYRLTLLQNRGYGDIVDNEMTILIIWPRRLLPLFIIIVLVLASILALTVIKSRKHAN